jgi:hypothetical protein
LSGYGSRFSLVSIKFSVAYDPRGCGTLGSTFAGPVAVPKRFRPFGGKFYS